jgi:nicotinamide riboside kinase
MGQLGLEDEAEKECRKNNLSMIFYDTDLTVIKIWSEFKYGKCDPLILEQYNRRKYDLYLLTYPDLKWLPDPLRENPKNSDRMKIFELYHNDLNFRNLEFYVIRGADEIRNKNAIEIVDSLLK